MKPEKQISWFSNGNLILSGEYFVLTGAKALAVPLKYGQKMSILSSRNGNNTIIWKTNEPGKQWFNCELNCETLDIKNSSNTEVVRELQSILRAVKKYKPELFNKEISYEITCDVNFSMDWGWGSSASLTVNLSKWAGIDPFMLNNQISNGSGYDIAASLSSAPVIYQIKNGHQETNQVYFNPVFSKYISFIYLGQKQSTKASIEKNLESVKKNDTLIPLITSLTEKIAAEENVEEFVRCMVEHEKIIAGVLKMKRIKELHFPDFKGEMKSLGAWGGDFAMVVSPLDILRVKQYFIKKNLNILFRFDEIIKNKITEI